jgi:hypothetical protein
MTFPNIVHDIYYGCRVESFPSALFPFKPIRNKPAKRYRKNEYYGGRTVSRVALAKVEGTGLIAQGRAGQDIAPNTLPIIHCIFLPLVNSKQTASLYEIFRND